MLEELQSSNQFYDAVVLGSSHAYRGIDPAIFEEHNLNIYVAGSSAQNCFGGRIIYENQIRGKTKVIVQDIYDLIFERDISESNLRLIENLPTIKESWELTSQSLTMNTFTAFLIRLAEIDQKEEVKLDESFYKGYAGKSGSITTVAAPTDSVFDANQEVFRCFEEFVQELKKENIKLVLVSHPLPQNPELIRYHRQFLELFTPLVEKYNLKYFDYTNYCENFSLADFSDQTHLNTQGVRKYNELLLANQEFVGELKP